MGTRVVLEQLPVYSISSTCIKVPVYMYIPKLADRVARLAAFEIDILPHDGAEKAIIKARKLFDTNQLCSPWNLKKTRNMPVRYLRWVVRRSTTDRSHGVRGTGSDSNDARNEDGEHWHSE